MDKMNSLGKRNHSSVSGSYHIKMIQASLDATSATGPTEMIPILLRAAMIGDLSALNIMLGRGADVNSSDEQGRTALIEAVFGGHLDVVKLLIARGADINASDKDGWTALIEASSKGCHEIAEVLILNGADANRQNKNGWTALKSIAKGHFKLARLLRKAAGARINPIHIARVQQG